MPGVAEATSPEYEVEHIPVTSLWSLVCQLQTVVTSQQEMLAAKDKQIENLQKVIASQQLTNQIQEEANRCLWEELKSHKSPEQDSIIAVAEETVSGPETVESVEEGQGSGVMAK